MDKDYCRDYINRYRKYLNLKQICLYCDVQPPHLTMFLKGSHYDSFMNIDKLIVICEFIGNIGK